MQSRRMDTHIGAITYHRTAPEIKVSLRGSWLDNGVSHRIATQHAEQKKNPQLIARGLHAAGECNTMAHQLLRKRINQHLTNRRRRKYGGGVKHYGATSGGNIVQVSKSRGQRGRNCA